MKNSIATYLTKDREILKVIEAARNRDSEALNIFPVNKFDKKTGFNAAMILAYYKEMEAVKFLEPYINKAYDIKDFIVRGFAASGDTDLILEWIKNGGAAVNAVSDAAIGGHESLLNQLLKSSGSHNIESALCGAVTGKHKHLTKWLIKEHGVDPAEALNEALSNNSFNFATYLISNYKILPKEIFPFYNNNLKHHLKNQYNIYPFLHGIIDNELRELYISHIADILNISSNDISTKFNNMLKDMKDLNLSFSDVRVLHIEKEYLQKGHLTPLGNYLTSFYGLYKTNQFMVEGEVAVKFIPTEILNKIAHYCITAPKLTLNGEINYRKYPTLSENGINKVVDLWLGRISDVQSTRYNNGYLNNILNLALTAYRDYLPAVISEPINYVYNSVTGFTAKLTAQQPESRENRI